MIKFSKDDIGLYVALGMIGAGLGIMVGSVVYSKLLRLKFEREVEEFYLEDEPYEHGEDIYEIEEEEHTVKEDSEELDDAMKAFVEKYEPTSVQFELVRSGIISMEKAIETIEYDRQLKAQYTSTSYSGIYKPDSVKPDLEELVDDEDLPEDGHPLVVEGQYNIYDDILEEDGLPVLDAIILYDPDDNTWQRVSSMHGLVAIGGVDRYISDTAWDEVELALKRTMNPIFVQDTKRDKMYKFELVPSDEGDQMMQGLRGPVS